MAGAIMPPVLAPAPMTDFRRCQLIADNTPHASISQMPNTRRLARGHAMILIFRDFASLLVPAIVLPQRVRARD